MVLRLARGLRREAPSRYNSGRTMPPKLETVGDILHWSYANLAMAHAAVELGARSYGPGLYAIRSRLFGRLRSGEARLGSLLDDERVKLNAGRACAYCASPGPLTMDHLLARSRGGPDSADNIVWACRPCNSSKGDRDLAAWYQRREVFPPLLLLRRYLKLAHSAAELAGALAMGPGEAEGLPFDLAAVPLRFPAPAMLALWVSP